LTINQTSFNEKSDQSLEHPWYKKWTSSEPKVLLYNNKPYKKKINKGYYDLYIIHPRTTYIKDRPSFVFSKKAKPVTINLDSIRIEKPYLILAFKNEEDYQKAVPLDIIEVKETTGEQVTFALEKGSYNFIIPTSDDKAYLFNKKVE